MKKEITFILLLSALFCFNAHSQKITGIVLDAESEAVAYANVALYNAIDSSLVKVELTDNEGHFQIIGIPASKYWLSISYVGLPPYTSEVFDLLTDYKVSTVTLRESSTELSEVTVVAKRPLLEVKPDKMVFNVEGSINATGNNALELLRKAPGVIVDNNDKISLLGRSGVMIYIDGKPSSLTGESLAAYLKSMQASEIDNIEIITNPSAKYDAQGTGGIINIRLKKDQRLGANANINLGYAQGQRKTYNGSLSTNYRSKRFNIFGNYSHNDGQELNYLNLYREQNGLFFDPASEMYGGSKNHNFKTGTDYFLNKKNTFGLMVNGNFSDGDWNSISRTPIGTLSKQTIDSVLIAERYSQGKSSNLNFNLNYQFNDGKDKTVNIDFDLGRYRKDSKAVQPNTYMNANETEVLNERKYKTERPKDIDIYTAKIDAALPIAEGKISFGAKSSLVKTDNVFNFYNAFDDIDILDLNRSNSFTYSENVNAAYVNYSRKIKKLAIQAGIRAEQTNSEGDLQSISPTEEDNVKRNYLDFFPSAGLTYQLNAKNSLQLTYSRRVNRPSYQDLNPFENKIDELSFQKGNPFLNPEYTQSIQLRHTFNYFLNTSIGYSHTTDLISRITDTVGVNQTMITWLNLAEQRSYRINVSGSIPINKWWSTYSSLTGYVISNYAEFEDGKTIDLSVPAFNLYSQHTFKLPWKLSLEISGRFNSGSVWEGNFKTSPQGSVSIGVQKKIFDGRGNLKISVGDIFKTTDWKINSQFGPLLIRGTGGWDSRRVRMSFSYLFGNNQVKKSRRRNAGLKEESRRVKGEK